MNPAVAVIGTLRFPAERVAEVLPHLRALVEATNRFDGCIAYDVAEDPFDRGLILFSELWPDRASLERHLQAEQIAPWRVASKACGLIERQFTAFAIGGSWSV